MAWPIERKHPRVKIALAAEARHSLENYSRQRRGLLHRDGADTGPRKRNRRTALAGQRKNRGASGSG
jgi:hypothetical protein